jgi:hypothetical protein
MARFVHDMPDHILQMQVDIVLAKPPHERLKIAGEMMQMVWHQAEGRVKRRWPDLTLPELKVKIFEEIYRDDFTPEQLQDITQKMYEFWQNKVREMNENSASGLSENT